MLNNVILEYDKVIKREWFETSKSFARKIEFHDSGNVHDRAEFHVVSGNLALSSTKHVDDGSDLMMLGT